MSHPQYTGRPRTSRTIKEEDAEFIKENYKELSVKKISKKLDIPERTIYRFMDAHGLKTLDRIIRRSKREPKKRDVPEDCFSWEDYRPSTI